MPRSYDHDFVVSRIVGSAFRRRHGQQIALRGRHRHPVGHNVACAAIAATARGAGRTALAATASAGPLRTHLALPHLQPANQAAPALVAAGVARATAPAAAIAVTPVPASIATWRSLPGGQGRPGRVGRFAAGRRKRLARSRWERRFVLVGLRRGHIRGEQTNCDDVENAEPHGSCTPYQKIVRDFVVRLTGCVRIRLNH
jgi:hypothetical protein